MTEAEFTPYIDGAEPIAHTEIYDEIYDDVLKMPRIVYYGETPEGVETPLRDNKDPIIIEDSAGETPYSVLISGDLKTAKTVLVKAMAWSDHPGRGFEALREALIADPSNGLAVIGVSFPGTFLSSQRLNAKQSETLKKDGFEYIASQQWQAIEIALRTELFARTGSTAQTDELMRRYEYILSGNSQGSVNAVGLLQSAPEGLRVVALGLAQEVGLEAQGWAEFRMRFAKYGNKNFKNYVNENPYNQFPDLGPDFGSLTLLTRVAFRPGSHLGAVVEAMRRGGDIDKIIAAVREKDIQDLAITLATGSEDGVASAEMMQKAIKVLNASGLVVANSVVWQGHYHPAMENLANAREAFRSFTR